MGKQLTATERYKGLSVLYYRDGESVLDTVHSVIHSSLQGGTYVLTQDGNDVVSVLTVHTDSRNGRQYLDGVHKPNGCRGCGLPMGKPGTYCRRCTDERDDAQTAHERELGLRHGGVVA